MGTVRGSSFAGFLDGYKSNNIASIEGFIQLKIDDLIDLLKSAIDPNNNVDPEFSYFVQKNIDLLNQKSRADLIELLVSFGESLKVNIRLINTCTGAAKEKTRKVLYNFIEIAKMIEDSRLINIAMYIGSNYIA